MIPAEIMQPCEFSGTPVFEVARDFATDLHALPSYEVAFKMTVAFQNHKGPHHAEQVCKRHRSPRSHMASIATVGAAAALAVSAGAANAQDATTAPANPASGTVYTGDVIDGKKVVSALDVNDLEPGRKHLLYFQGVEMPTGQHWYVSVTVAKGRGRASASFSSAACMATR